jgi:hypothetical protein
VYERVVERNSSHSLSVIYQSTDVDVVGLSNPK